MIFDPGDLRHRVDIYRGDEILYHNIHASIVPIRGSEYYNARVTEAKSTATIVIRYRKGIDEGCQVVYGDKVYDINSVVNPYEENESLELYVEYKRRGTTPATKPGTGSGGGWEP